MKNNFARAVHSFILISLISKKNNFARATHFLLYYAVVLHD